MFASYRDEFEKNGFVKIKGVLPPEMIEMYKAFIDITHTKGMRKPEFGTYLGGEIDSIDHNILDDSCH